MTERARLKTARRWVVKIGSALLTREGKGIDADAIRAWVDQMVELRQRGIELILVSSGSVVEGMSRLGWKQRPVALYELQAAAAVGQMGLARVFETCFEARQVLSAQILLTHDDISNRVRYLNARSTLRKLVSLGVIPVINENDTVSTEGIMLGDNDTLAGLVTNLVEADLCVLLTDQVGLLTGDPRRDPDARLVSLGKAGDPALEIMAGESGQFGRGGMRTKLKAAALAARSGTPTVIAPGLEAGVLLKLSEGVPLGTLLEPAQAPLAARKRWLAGQLKVMGRLMLDEGAARVLMTSGKSLLAVGVKGVEGEFARGELVSCIDPDQREVARGLVNYGAGETRKIMGVASGRIVELLGYVDEPELIHRDNLVLIGK